MDAAVDTIRHNEQEENHPSSLISYRRGLGRQRMRKRDFWFRGEYRG